MENPTKEIEDVILNLTQGSPEDQKATLQEYFLPNASFTHPFAHVPAFSQGSLPLLGGIDSRWVIQSIYRWYRTLSPSIDAKVESVAFDENKGLLYVSIHQTFALWFVPFYNAPVRLVSVLQLKKTSHSPNGDSHSNGNGNGNGNSSKYFIVSQADLYSLRDCFQFLTPTVGPFLWRLWQLFSTVLCVIGSLILLPLFFFLNRPSEKMD